MSMNVRGHRVSLEVWVFLAVLLVRIAGVAVVYAVSAFHSVPFPVVGADSGGYEVLTRNLLDHGVFSRSESAPFLPDSFRTPGYPVFAAVLVGFSGTFFAVIAAQVILSACTAVLLFRLASQYLSSRMRWAPVILYLANPMSAYLASVVLSETLFTVLLLASVVVLVRADAPRPFGAGLLLGSAALVRPAGLVLLPVFLLYCLFAWRRSLPWRKAAWCLLGFMLLVAPWSVRNKMLFDSWQLSTVGTYNFYEYHATLFYAQREGITHRAAINDVFHPQLIRRRPAVVIGEYTLADMPAMRSVAWEYIRDDMPSFAVFYGIKTLPFFLSDGIGDILSKIGIASRQPFNASSLLLRGEIGELTKMLFTRESFLFLAESILWACLTASAFVGTLGGIARAGNQRYAILFFAVLVVASALAAGTVSNARLREPAAPFLFVLAAYGFPYVARTFRKVVKRARAVAY